ncbi:MAG: DUF2442 domain-containing protein [Nitrospirales bacterium]
MLKSIVEVRPVERYRLHLRFEGGVQGEVDIAQLVRFEGVFAPLKDRAVFSQVQVHPELGSIQFPNGADLDPDVLFATITGNSIPHLAPKVGKA